MICKKVASYSALKPSRALPRVYEIYETNSENRFSLLRKCCSREVYCTFVVSLQLRCAEDVTCKCSLENTDLNETSKNQTFGLENSDLESQASKAQTSNVAEEKRS